MGVVVLQVIKRRAPVPGLDIIGAQLDHGIQQLQRDIHLLRVHRRLGAHHQQRRGVARGLQPHRPDPRLDMLGAGFIGRGLQRAEQEIQTAGAVGADLGQLARRFRQLLLLLRRRDDPWIVLGKRHDRHGHHAPRARIAIRAVPGASGISKPWAKSRRTKSRCKAARRQRPVKRGGGATGGNSAIAQRELSLGGP